MDSDFWTSCLAAAKRQYNSLQHQQLHHHRSSSLDRLGIDSYEVDEEIRPDFSCPYCCEDFDIASLCSHLEDEHPYESKVTVCPVCSVKVAGDMFSHITLQHGHLFKLQRRRRLSRVAIPNSQALSVLNRDLREAHLQALLGGGSSNIGGFRLSNIANNYNNNMLSSSSASTDPFLSSLILNFPPSEVEEETSKSELNPVQDVSAKNAVRKPTLHMWKLSIDASLSKEEREKRKRQAAGRAAFMQDLMVSTLIED